VRRPWGERRAALERLFADSGLGAPWTLCPVTDDAAQARRWLEEWGPFGIEGLLLKDTGRRYLPGARGWRKYRVRHTAEAVVGAVTGSVGRPRSVLLGRPGADGRLRYVGRSGPLGPEAVQGLAAVLRPAGPGHPWEGRQFSAGWGSRGLLVVELAEPDVVAEVSADVSLTSGGQWRHQVRYVRLRPDLAPGDVPGTGPL
jgi:ATP-dependent DNA ligase